MTDSPLPSFSVEVERGRLRSYANAIEERDPIYRDVPAARAAGHPDLPVMPCFLFGVELESRGDGDSLDALGVDLTAVRHTEQKFTYHSTAHAGDVLTFRPRITADHVRQRMRFLSRSTAVTRADGTRVADLDQTIVVLLQPEGAES
jgi:hypothetical protein